MIRLKWRKDRQAPVKAQIHKLWAARDRSSYIRYGTVAQVSPLLINLDGDIDLDENSPTFGDPVSSPAQSLVTHTVGQRVICAEQYRRVLVIQA